MDQRERLRHKINNLQCELDETSRLLRELEEAEATPEENSSPYPLHLDEYRRYGRQMILEGFGLSSQLRLKDARVLVIGAGGLGCPALQYLAAAGVGELGIIDNDIVELSNLQRQILHSDDRIGMPKALSAKMAISQINPNVKVNAIVDTFNSTNAIYALSGYSLVLDCTDNPSTRYLVSDASRALSIPLISGAAMRYDGQLCLYNYGESGPCYRCLFPVPPKPETVGTCEDVGVLGVVTGIVGTLQAMEAIKLLISSLPEDATKEITPSMLLFSARSPTPFRTAKLRSRRPTCPTCSLEPDALRDHITTTDYITFCGGIGESARITGQKPGPTRLGVKDLKLWMDEIVSSSEERVLFDVRPSVEYAICSLPNSTNVPLTSLRANPKIVFDEALSHIQTDYTHRKKRDIVVICRQGNDSQVAASILRIALSDHDIDENVGDEVADPGKGKLIEEAKLNEFTIRDVRGGLRAWHELVDPQFPVY